MKTADLQRFALQVRVLGAADHDVRRSAATPTARGSSGTSPCRVAEELQTKRLSSQNGSGPPADEVGPPTARNHDTDRQDKATLAAMIGCGNGGVAPYFWSSFQAAPSAGPCCMRSAEFEETLSTASSSAGADALGPPRTPAPWSPQAEANDEERGAR